VNWASVLLWGFVATVMLSTIMSASQQFGFSRMSMPFILGAIFTPHRGPAAVLGFAIHFVNGWAFALVYALAFESLGRATWWLGAGMGLVQALFTLVVVLPILPGIHPRMASEEQGPEPTRELEPPGVMGLNYGRRTPLVTIFAHLVYGAIIGGFYRRIGG
jgi:uncharacterized membrane protein YagU involved in acid resistance